MCGTEYEYYWGAAVNRQDVTGMIIIRCDDIIERCGISRFGTDLPLMDTSLVLYVYLHTNMFETYLFEKHYH